MCVCVCVCVCVTTIQNCCFRFIFYSKIIFDFRIVTSHSKITLYRA